ncbi:putative membrane protein [Amycolatopsis arida]|uniref:Putative membrane protein n=1 Tax=Amycolatopsis arida TaxID=587909 RepID=A0A1I5WAX0_9PSEU|nr:DUF4142 domain-containing protein [Amycolatopsis arida]TDX92192.1 putative membrane protein [Amycolatopsis arida]SFQ16821.1 putative membrane protein [Amycolatopsis arida]
MRKIRLLLAAGMASALALTTAPAAQASPQTALASASALSEVRAQHGTRQLSAQDLAFLRASHQGNLAEIWAGSTAQVKGQCADVRHLGAMLVRDHLRLDANGFAVAVPHGVLLPMAPTAQQRGELKEVAAKSGREFDLAWLRMQVEAHIATLELGQRQLELGHSPEVKRLAREAAPVIQHHLDRARAALITC